jgi:hypothetical protein
MMKANICCWFRTWCCCYKILAVQSVALVAHHQQPKKPIMGYGIIESSEAGPHGVRYHRMITEHAAGRLLLNSLLIRHQQQNSPYGFHMQVPTQTNTTCAVHNLVPIVTAELHNARATICNLVAAIQISFIPYSHACSRYAALPCGIR